MTDTQFFGSVADALLLDDKDTTLTVLVNDERVDALSARSQHGRSSPVGRCDILFELPVSFALGSAIRVEAGYGSAVGTIFDGTIPEDEDAISDEGYWTRVQAVDHTQRLVAPSRNDILFPVGRISPKSIFESCCAMRGVPNFLSDNTTELNSTTIIELAGVAEVDNGRVIIPAGTGLLEWMQRVFNMFEYYVFGSPQGIVRLARFVSPPPPETIVTSYIEGQHVIRLTRIRSAHDIVNDWEVTGAEYELEDGTPVSIRSISATVESEPLLPPLNYRHGSIDDDILVRLDLAEAVRNAKEVRYGELSPGWEWEVEGDPERMPGDPVMIEQVSTGTVEYVLIDDITQDVDESGYWATMRGSVGHGSPQAPGDDCVTIPLMTPGQTVHLGNEFLTNYRNPAVNGNAGALLHKITFEVPEDFNSLVIRGFAHGTNSLLAGPIDASRFEIWQGSPLEKGPDGELPRQPESLSIKYGVGFDSNWTPIAIPLKGSIKAGTAELRIISGQNDDFEVRDLSLTACGVGTPTYPSEGEGF